MCYTKKIQVIFFVLLLAISVYVTDTRAGANDRVGQFSPGRHDNVFFIVSCSTSTLTSVTMLALGRLPVML